MEYEVKRSTALVSGFLLLVTLLGVVVVILMKQADRGDDYTAKLIEEAENQEPKVFSIMYGDVSDGDAYAIAEPEEELGGRLHLTLVDSSKVTNLEEFIPHEMYELSVAEESVPRLLQEFTGVGLTTNVRESDGSLVLSALMPVVTTEEFNVNSVYHPEIALLRNGEFKQLSATTTHETVDILRKRTPRIANTSDRVIYSAQVSRYKGEELDLASPILPFDRWKVYLTDTDGTDAFVTSGAHAVWSRDDRFIFFLREDGLYVKRMDVEEGVENRIITPTDEYSGFQYDSHMQIDETGTYLFINDETSNLYDASSKVLIYRIEYSDSGLPSATLVSELATENGRLYWPVVSPGGRYLAAYAVDSLSTGRFLDRENKRVLVYDLKERKVVREFSLEDYLVHYTILSDWVR